MFPSIMNKKFSLSSNLDYVILLGNRFDKSTDKVFIQKSKDDYSK